MDNFNPENKPHITIVHASTEMMPYARRGGVADVVHGIAHALSSLKQHVIVFIPFYSNVNVDEHRIETTGKTGSVDGEEFEILYANSNGVKVYLIKHEAFGHRPYEGDEFRTACLFTKMLLKSLQVLEIQPHIIHCHDWHTGLISGHLKYNRDLYFADTVPLFTIHNLGYRGFFEKSRFSESGLPQKAYRNYEDGKDGFSLLKGGIVCTGFGRVNTVSPNYAKEITKTDLGWGMQPILKKVNVFGILNGIDYGIYNPSEDPHIPFPYTRDNCIEARKENKRALQQIHFKTPDDCPNSPNGPVVMPGGGLEEDDDAFLIGMIARVAEQKGVEVVCEALKILLSEGADVQFIFNGQPRGYGDKYCREIINILSPLAEAYKGKMLIRFSYEFDYTLAQKMYASCDAIVCAPQYEPCGLEPMKAVRYGCIPVTRATGGLVDQVVEYDPESTSEGNGFLFNVRTPKAVSSAIRNAMNLYLDQRPEWDRLVRDTMEKDFSWTESTRKYLRLYYRQATLKEKV